LLIPRLGFIYRTTRKLWGFLFVSPVLLLFRESVAGKEGFS